MNPIERSIDSMLAKEKERFEAYMRQKGYSERKLRKHLIVHSYMEEDVAKVWLGWSEKAIYDFNQAQVACYIDPQDLAEFNNSSNNAIQVYIYKSGSLLTPLFQKE